MNKIAIELTQGNIADVEADALVNAANNRLVMGAGVAGALKRQGGRKIETEAMQKGPIPIGEAVATGAGKLIAKYVIHAAVMGMDFRTNADYIRQATLNSLKRAEELKLQTIAFPALGTGVGGFPKEECARIMLGEISRFPANSLERAIFVLYDETTLETFRRELPKER